MKNSKIHNRFPFTKRNLRDLILFFIGLAALVWFLIRVIPKPSRAAYPCQQAAFPFASAFVIWLTGILSSSLLFVKAKSKWRRSKYILAIVLFSLAMSVFMVTSTSLKYTPALARAYIFTNDLIGNPLPVLQSFTEEDSLIVEPSAYVGIVKSFQTQAEDIEFDEILAMVSEAIAKAGGLEGIVSDGDTVILKPNLVASIDGTASAQQLDPEVNGITTDYRVVQAVVNNVRVINPSGQIYVLEGSADGSTAANMAILNYNLITGIDSLIPLEEVCGAWGDTSSIHLQAVSLPTGEALYDGSNNRYWLHKLYYNADVIISMPVLKNHFYTGTTGSVKNVGIGATPPSLYTLASGELLRLVIDHEDPPRTNLHYWIHDYFMCKPVDFVVVDGLQSVQNGPVSTYTTQQLSDDQMNMRLILAGKDPIAIDAINSLLTCHDPELTPHLVTLHNDSYGCCDARLIRVNGNKVGDEKKDFVIDDTGLLSKYFDFEAPTFTVNECYVVGNQLYFSLTVDDDVTKVEVSVDSIYLKQIVIGGFDSFSLDLDSLEINSGSQVTVYAYDQYLNYSKDVLIATSVPGEEISAQHVMSVMIVPNPCANTARLRLTTHDSQFTAIDIYSISGNKIRDLINQEIPAGEHEIEIDVSDLPVGVYIVRMQSGMEFAIAKLLVVH